ncbi:YlqD family protein [Succinispira mobilis]|uniref:YlqD family protein n=1 Tax=Succinispira mobilis TaxID=78120 RepID=UPI000381C5A8|nr:YlqD family protein [Succinispira mobilis]
MQSMMVRLPINIKAKVTEKLKRELTNEFTANLKNVEYELEQIEFHGKRMLAEQAKQDAQGLPALREQIEAERAKRLEAKNELETKIAATEKLELGAEIMRGNMERVYELKVGDVLDEIIGAEILLEDGKVIAFRE